MLRPTGPVSEVKCANNIGIKIFGANPFVSRETGTLSGVWMPRPAKPHSENILAFVRQPTVIEAEYRFRPPQAPSMCQCGVLGRWAALSLSVRPRAKCTPADRRCRTTSPPTCPAQGVLTRRGGDPSRHAAPDSAPGIEEPATPGRRPARIARRGLLGRGVCGQGSRVTGWGPATDQSAALPRLVTANHEVQSPETLALLADALAIGRTSRPQRTRPARDRQRAAESRSVGLRHR